VVKARCTDATLMTLAVTGHTAVSGVEGADDTWTFEVSGLTANTSYPFGFPGSSLTGTIKTFPAAGSQASFVVCASGDAGYPNPPSEYEVIAETSNAPTFDRIRDRDPAIFLHLGDYHYRNISTASLSAYRQAFRDVLANSRQHQLYRNVPTSFIWDDHDYGPDNSDRTLTGRAEAIQTFREYVPCYPLPADTRPGGDGEIYHSFVIGRVRFIRLDTRSSRDPNTDPDTSSKSMIGEDQKAWLKAELLAATEPCIVLGVSGPWIPPVSSAVDEDAWSGFGTERQELAEFFEDNALTTRLLLLHADYHECIADDGTNTQFDPGSANPGPGLVAFAPLDSLEADYGYTTYTTGPFYEAQQYGVLSFDDQGSQIVVTATAYQVDDAVETEQFEVQFTYPA
jgi:phosphodiesterase/alkaline phosphatase D-like protein